MPTSMPLSIAATSPTPPSSQPMSPTATSTRTAPRHHRRTSSTFSRTLSPQSPLSPAPFNFSSSSYRDTHDHSPPSTPNRSASSRTPSRHRRASSTASAISNYALDNMTPRSPNPLLPEKVIVHSFDRVLLAQWHVDECLWLHLPTSIQRVLGRLQERGAAVEEARARCASLWAEAGSRGWPLGWQEDAVRNGGNQEGGFDEISWHFYAAECASFLHAARADAIGLLHAASRVVNEVSEVVKAGSVEVDRAALEELGEWMKRVGTPRSEELKRVVDALECPEIMDVKADVMTQAGKTLETE